MQLGLQQLFDEIDDENNRLRILLWTNRVCASENYRHLTLQHFY